MKFWQADIHSFSRHTRLHVTTVNCSETLFPWDYEARAAGPRMLSEHAVLQCAASCRGEEWKVVTCLLLPLASSPNPIIPSPLLSSWCSLLSPSLAENAFVSVFCEFAKLKRAGGEMQPSLDAQCRGVLSCLNKQKNFKKAISPLLKVVHFFIITP